MRRWLVGVGVGVGLVTGCAEHSSNRPAAEAEVEAQSSARTYLEEGLASYYGEGMEGGRTASGEKLDSKALTAAHRTLPFGTCLRVVNMENRRSVEVRVNDRGPFKAGRVVDVSLAAARKLELVGKGLARVRLYRCAPGSG
jgi:rare lipoprotein A